MPSGSKKKKANPARGFATTSVVSKSQLAASDKLTPASVNATTDDGDKTLDGAAADKHIKPEDQAGGGVDLPKRLVDVGKVQVVAEKELKDLTPAELEERLHRAELQSLVDKFSARSTRDASRIAARWATETRVLRASTAFTSDSAAQRLSLSSLGLDSTGPKAAEKAKLLERLVDLTRQDVAAGIFSYTSSSSNAVSSTAQASAATSVKSSKRRHGLVLGEEEATGRLWTLERALAALGFDGGLYEEKKHDLMTLVLDHATAIETHLKSSGDVSVVWGLEEALDWLVLHFNVADLPEYDSSTGRVKRLKRALKTADTNAATVTQSSGTDKGEIAEAANKETGPIQRGKRKLLPIQHTNGQLQRKKPVDAVEEVEEIVSDMDSDLEPDELLTIYLATKERLYHIDPGLVLPMNTKTAAGKKMNKKGKPSSVEKSHVKPKTVVKLQQRLTSIEADALFNKAGAEEQWMQRRILLARDQAAQRLAQVINFEKDAGPNEPHVSDSESDSSESEGGVETGLLAMRSNNSRKPASQDESEVPSDEDDEDGDGIGIGALFAALPSEESGLSQQPNGDAANSTSMTIRDFGTIKGTSPRRVLEETCRARDPGVHFSYKLISRTAFSNRHAITITWSREQSDLSPSFDVQGLSSTSSSLKTNEFAMLTIATPDAHQSESFVATYALFQLFYESTREEKSYLRLPPAWRNLWFEFMELKRSSTDAEERKAVEQLRYIYRSHVEHLSRTSSATDLINDAGVVLKTGSSPQTTDPIQESANAFAADSASPMNSAAQPDPQTFKDIWSAKSAAPAFNSMLSIRSRLPMHAFKSTAVAAVEESRVTILCGETGCGKSTQLPSFILEHELSQGRDCRIFVTEPRRISAVTLAQRVSEELGEVPMSDLGTSRSLVGYAIRLESKTAASTRLVYATTGIVLRMLESDQGIDGVTHIVVDEVHERSIETDFLLIILRSLLLKRPSLKVVLMSATVDAHKFTAYFREFNPPVLNVPGRTFPVTTKYLEDAVELTGHIIEDGVDQSAESYDGDGIDASDSVAAASRVHGYSSQTKATIAKMNEHRIDYGLIVSLIEKIATAPEFMQFKKAILVFLPGIAEIRRLYDMLAASRVTSGSRFIIHTLHSSIASEDQQKAFTAPPKGMGKIVLSTNIAETGVTIPDVTCVIDSGKHKEMRFDERRQISRLIESFISRANAKQRRGRAGRVQEGLCFHLFTKDRHDTGIAEHQTPEMLRLSLQDLVMRVKICKLGDIQSTLAQALDPPLPKNIQRAIDALIEVGALTTSQDLTSLGQQLSKLPLDPYLGKLVLYGALFGCLDIAITIAAILTSKSPFVTPGGGASKSAADLARLSFKRSDSDLMTEFNAYSSWRRVCISNSSFEAQFCRKNLLSLTSLCNIEDLKAQLSSSIVDAGFIKLSSVERTALSRVQNSSSGGPGRSRRTFVQMPAELNEHSENPLAAESVIAWSFYPKLLVKDGKGWRNVSNNSTIALHPTSIMRQLPTNSSSALPGNAGPKFLSYYSIMQSAGSKHPLAHYLHPVSPLPLVLLSGAADATFHPLARVLSIDGARLRFNLEGQDWQIFLGIKYLRARLEEMVRRKWKKPESSVPESLQKWWLLWIDLLEIFKTDS